MSFVKGLKLIYFQELTAQDKVKINCITSIIIKLCVIYLLVFL